ncbi:MAG: MFS transporter [Verrucomicrobia bacterium]|nr:MFS transporter [Verrucomicrobiota bacterium]
MPTDFETAGPVRGAPRGMGTGRRWTGLGEFRGGELRSLLAAGALFFILLTAIMVLRPVREALGLARGIENVRHLFLVTVAATLLAASVFGRVVSRIPRHRLLTVSFRSCAVILLGFLAGTGLWPEAARGWLGSVYYVFHSVFNLFVVSLFWAFMADHFSLTESKRLFPAIAMGGSLGAIVGSLISWQLAEQVGVTWLFGIAALLLELAVWAAIAFARTRSLVTGHRMPLLPLGGASLAGLKAVAQSPYIRALALFVALVGVVSTLLYFTSLRLVAAASDSTAHQTVLFAHINLWMQLATLLAQAFLAARIMRWAGVGVALAMLPALAVAGFAALALVPTLAVFTVVNAVFRAAQQGVAGPARETLFTVLQPQDKYKAKSFVDTFGYRTGDAGGALLERPLAALSPTVLPLASAVFALAILWVALSFFLGHAQTRLAGRHPQGGG